MKRKKGLLYIPLMPLYFVSFSACFLSFPPFFLKAEEKTFFSSFGFFQQKKKVRNFFAQKNLKKLSALILITLKNPWIEGQAGRWLEAKNPFLSNLVAADVSLCWIIDRVRRSWWKSLLGEENQSSVSSSFFWPLKLARGRNAIQTSSFFRRKKEWSWKKYCVLLCC